MPVPVPDRRLCCRRTVRSRTGRSATNPALVSPALLRRQLSLVGAEKHFGAYVKRDGTVTAGSTWAGAKVQEVGLHDVFGDQVRGTGYLTFTLPSGDRISMKHECVGTFLPTANGRMAPVDHGFWTILGGLEATRASVESDTSSSGPRTIRTTASGS